MIFTVVFIRYRAFSREMLASLQFHTQATQLTIVNNKTLVTGGGEDLLHTYK